MRGLNGGSQSVSVSKGSLKVVVVVGNTGRPLTLPLPLPLPLSPEYRGEGMPPLRGLNGAGWHCFGVL